MEKLAQYNRERVLDVLGERLAFERTGVRLYDATLAAMRRSGDPKIQDMIDEMQEYRDDEKEHEEWLEGIIRSLGGDAHAETERVRLIASESKGIEAVILDAGRPLSHMFHAMLIAELADNAGWDLLVELADEAGDRAAKKEFKKRLHREEEHLTFMRRANELFVEREVLGITAETPPAP